MIKRQKKKTIGIFKKSIGLFFIILAIIFGTVGFIQYEKEKKEDTKALAVYNEIEEIALNINTNVDTNDLIINWNILKEYDVVGWIIAGDDISFPIVQSNNNSYYLYRLYDGTYNANGSIFMDCASSNDFTDLNTIIYGHRMRSGTMFGPLVELLEYSDDNIKEFDIYLPDGTRHIYDIYSTTKVKADGYAYTYQFGSLENFREYKEKLKANAQYDTGIETTDAKTVMLSTCDSGSYYGNRIVILGQEKEVRQVQDPASWYVKKDCIEINSKNSTCIIKNNKYYILYNNIAIRCLKENADDIFSDKSKTIVAIVEYIETDEFLTYEEIDGNIKEYQVFDIYNYEIK